MLFRILITRSTVIALMIIATLIMGVAAGCSDEGGMRQGGGDSEPSWY